MKILVTGGCGFVGTLLTKALLAEGHDIHVYDIMWFGNYLEDHPRLSITLGDVRNIESVPIEGMDAEAIARRSVEIAAEICVYTNTNIIIESMDTA